MHIKIPTIVELSNNSFIQSRWKPTEGDYIWDGLRIVTLGIQYFSNNKDVLKIAIPYFKGEWKKDFRSVEYKTIDLSVLTIFDPLWLPVGFDINTCESQIDKLLKERIGIATDVGLQSIIKDKLYYEWLGSNEPLVILKLRWLNKLTKETE